MKSASATAVEKAAAVGAAHSESYTRSIGEGGDGEEMLTKIEELMMELTRLMEGLEMM